LQTCTSKESRYQLAAKCLKYHGSCFPAEQNTKWAEEFILSEDGLEASELRTLSDGNECVLKSVLVP
jgi:hypothetical protein